MFGIRDVGTGLFLQGTIETGFLHLLRIGRDAKTLPGKIHRHQTAVHPLRQQRRPRRASARVQGPVEESVLRLLQ